MLKIPKFILLALFALALPTLAFAQKSLAQRMADDFCDQLNNMDIPTVWNEKTLELLGAAMSPVLEKYAVEIKSELGLDVSSDEGSEKVGNMVGKEASNSCPKFLKLVEQLAEPKVEEAISTSLLEGKFLDMEVSGQFAFIRLRENSGSEHKIWWMEEFPGAESLQGAPKLFKNKPVKVLYLERNIYDASLKVYVKLKVIAGFEAS